MIPARSQIDFFIVRASMYASGLLESEFLSKEALYLEAGGGGMRVGRKIKVFFRVGVATKRDDIIS